MHDTLGLGTAQFWIGLENRDNVDCTVSSKEGKREEREE